MRRFEAFLRWFFSRSAPLTFFALFLFGSLMVITSLLAGVGFKDLPLPDGTTKQVGYIWAFNWSFMFLIGFPVMFFFILETAESLRQSLRQLASRRMIIDGNWNAAPIEALESERHRIWQRATPIAALNLISLLVYCVGEWYFVAGQYLVSNTLPVPAAEVHWFKELDWSLAPLLPGSGDDGRGARIAVGLFGLVNYVALAFILAIVFTYYAILILYADTFRRLSQGDGAEGLRIVPDLDDDDPRRGFGVFEPVFRRIVIATLMGFLLCYFMNVQNLFLRTGSPDIWAFLANDVMYGFSTFLGGDIQEGLSKIVGQLFDVEYIFNITTVWAIVFVAGFFCAVALSMAWTLSQTAERSRDYLATHLQNPANSIDGFLFVDRDTARTRLANWDPEHRTGMVIWPFGWPALQQLLVFMAFGVICLVLYRVGLFFAGVAIAWTTVQALGVFKRGARA